MIQPNITLEDAEKATSEEIVTGAMRISGVKVAYHCIDSKSTLQ